MEKEDLFNGAMLADAISHVITVILISGSVVLVGAIVLNPQGTKNHSACTVGGAAGAVSWKCGKICHGTCSLGAGFSSCWAIRREVWYC